MTSTSLRARTVLPRAARAKGASRIRKHDAAIPLAAFAVFSVLYAVLGLRDQALGRTGAYDLGIFVQGVRGYAAGTGPISAIKGPGFNLLGDHFSPVTALIAPFYAVFPSASTLLVAQALLVAASIVPIARYAGRELGSGAAAVVAVAYGSSFGVASAVGFDFHEVAFAAPLLAMSCVAVARQRWWAAAAWAAPLVLVKEDLGVTVAAVGGVVALRGSRRIGLGLAAFGLGATALEMLVIVPAFNPGDSYAYSSQIGAGAGVLRTVLQEPGTKATTLLLTLAVTAFAAMRSPVALIALPTFAWRYLSAKPAYWGTDYHYDLLPMVVMFVALVHALSNGPGAHRAVLPRRWTLGIVLGTALLLIPTHPLGSLLQPSSWEPDARAGALTRAEQSVPDGATVAASGYMGPQLVDRTTVSYLWDPAALDSDPEWIVADLIEPGPWVQAGSAVDDVVARAEQAGWRKISEEQGVVVLRRD